MYSESGGIIPSLPDNGGGSEGGTDTPSIEDAVDATIELVEDKIVIHSSVSLSSYNTSKFNIASLHFTDDNDEFYDVINGIESVRVLNNTDIEVGIGEDVTIKDNVNNAYTEYDIMSYIVNKKIGMIEILNSNGNVQLLFKIDTSNQPLKTE